MKRMKSSLLFTIVFVGYLLLVHPNQMASAAGGKIAFSLDGEIYIIDDSGIRCREVDNALGADETGDRLSFTP